MASRDCCAQNKNISGLFWSVFGLFCLFLPFLPFFCLFWPLFTFVKPVGDAVEDDPVLAVAREPPHGAEGPGGVLLVVEVVAVHEDEAPARRRPDGDLDVGGGLGPRVGHLVAREQDEVVAPVKEKKLKLLTAKAKRIESACFNLLNW